MKKILRGLALFASLLAPSFALAQTASAPAYEGMAKNWQLNFQPAVTPVMEHLTTLHNYLLIVISLITILVFVLLVYIAVKFNRRANPVASKTTHHTMLEILWTVIPIIILVGIAIPSLRLHYFMEKNASPELTLKVVGYQWYWHYDYPDQGGFGYDSYIIKDKDLKPGQHRLLEVDNPVVVPVDTNVRVQITGADVIHSWSVPAFGLKRDAVPGRLNETWFKASQIGTFYGQCSQLCGVGHGFMPIVVNVVSKDDFAAWVKAQQAKAGINPAASGTATATAKKTAATAPAAASVPAKKPAPVATAPAADTPDSDSEGQ